jgi:hypothetical protein
VAVYDIKKGEKHAEEVLGFNGKALFFNKDEATSFYVWGPL